MHELYTWQIDKRIESLDLNIIYKQGDYVDSTKFDEKCRDVGLTNRQAKWVYSELD